MFEWSDRGERDRAFVDLAWSGWLVVRWRGGGDEIWGDPDVCALFSLDYGWVLEAGLWYPRMDEDDRVEGNQAIMVVSVTSGGERHHNGFSETKKETTDTKARFCICIVPCLASLFSL